MAHFFGFKSANMAQNWVDLHDINVALSCRMFKGVFDRPGAPSYLGFSPIEGQLFSSDRNQTSMHCWRAKYDIGHMRPALFLVYFCSNFMVLVLKRLKIRVIASNLQKCGKKCPFWTYALNKISQFYCFWPLWCVFFCIFYQIYWPTTEKNSKLPAETRSWVQKS